MSIINRYILRQFLLVFSLSIAVLGFIMTVGSFVKLVRTMDFALTPEMFFSLLLLMLPKILSYVMPVALLVAVSLVFSRLSAENEILALRSAGVSVWQIVAAPILLAGTMSVLCLYLNTSVIPKFEYAKKMFLKRQLFENPEMALQPQVPIRMGSKHIFIDSKDEQTGELLGVTMKEFDQTRELVKSQLYARRAHLSDKNNGGFTVHFEDVMIIKADAAEKSNESKEEQIKPLRVSNWPNENTSYRMSFEQEDERLVRKAKYLTMRQLVARIKDLSQKDENGQLTKYERKKKTGLSFLLSKSMAMAFAPLSFLLLALPFGFKSQRKETSVGLVVSLVIMVIYFGIVLMAGSMKDSSAMRPDILVWLPNIIYQLTGIFLLVFKVRA